MTSTIDLARGADLIQDFSEALRLQKKKPGNYTSRLRMFLRVIGKEVLDVTNEDLIAYAEQVDRVDLYALRTAWKWFRAYMTAAWPDLPFTQAMPDLPPLKPRVDGKRNYEIDYPVFFKHLPPFLSESKINADQILWLRFEDLTGSSDGSVRARVGMPLGLISAHKKDKHFVAQRREMVQRGDDLREVKIIPASTIQEHLVPMIDHCYPNKGYAQPDFDLESPLLPQGPGDDRGLDPDFVTKLRAAWKYHRKVPTSYAQMLRQQGLPGNYADMVKQQAKPVATASHEFGAAGDLVLKGFKWVSPLRTGLTVENQSPLNWARALHGQPVVPTDQVDPSPFWASQFAARADVPSVGLPAQKKAPTPAPPSAQVQYVVPPLPFKLGPYKAPPGAPQGGGMPAFDPATEPVSIKVAPRCAACGDQSRPRNEDKSFTSLIGGYCKACLDQEAETQAKAEKWREEQAKSKTQ